MTITLTYNPALASNLDIIRFLIGDTDSSDPELDDGEITYLLAQDSSLYLVAAEAARAISAKYARAVNSRMGQFSISESDKYRHYSELTTTLTRRATTGALPYAGGISLADKSSAEQDTDRVAPVFTRRLHETPGTITSPPIDPIADLIWP